jgi:hypothetical protein
MACEGGRELLHQRKAPQGALLLLLLPPPLSTRLQDQHDNARISMLFVTYAPASVSEELWFVDTLPLFKL